MIVRIGVDVVEVARIEHALRNPRFLARILTPRELESVGPWTPRRVAGRWAAKEAIAKCLLATPGWHQVEVLPGPEGEPIAHLSPGLLGPGERVHVSISHEGLIAAGFAVLER